jgi:hypothetical protein
VSSPTVSVNQVLDLIDRLPAKGKRAVRRALMSESDRWWQGQIARGEPDMRRLATDRGQNWDSTSEDEREAFVDTVLHEPD